MHGHTVLICNQPHRPTQPSTLSGMENEYGDVLWLGSLVVMASDLRLNGREFDPRLPHCQSFCTGMGDRLQVGIPP